jgi:hypothetical protein
LADFTTTEADQFLLDIWSNSIEEFRRRNLVFTQCVTMASEYGVNRVRGFQNLNIPTTTLLNSGTARQKAESTDITYDANTDSPYTLAIDQHWYQAYNTEEFADALSGFDIEGAYAPTIIEVVVRKEDATLGALVDNVTAQTVGAFAQPNTESELVRAVQYLDDADHPDNGRKWVWSNAGYLQFLLNNRYTSTDYVSDRPVDSGVIRRIYDYPALKSTNVEGSNPAGHDNGLLHRSWALHHRVGNRPRVRNFSDIDGFSEKTSASMIWGNAQMRTDAAVHIKGP